MSKAGKRVEVGAGQELRRDHLTRRIAPTCTAGVRRKMSEKLKFHRDLNRRTTVGYSSRCAAALTLMKWRFWRKRNYPKQCHGQRGRAKQMGLDDLTAFGPETGLHNV
jgi:hypothetical protein